MDTASDITAKFTNATAPPDAMVQKILEALDRGPWDMNPKTAVTIVVATPVVLMAFFLLCMVCRGIPSTPCGGKCTYWRRVPRGTQPDSGIGEHQDENCDVDSIDEQPMDPRLDDLDYDDGTEDTTADCSRRQCCSKMAAALENGAVGCNGVSGGGNMHDTDDGPRA